MKNQFADYSDLFLKSLSSDEVLPLRPHIKKEILAELARRETLYAAIRVLPADECGGFCGVDNE